MLPPWAADQCDKSLGLEFLPEKREQAAQVRAAEGRELSARGKFEVFAPVGKGAPSKAVADSRRALRWEMADG